MAVLSFHLRDRNLVREGQGLGGQAPRGTVTFDGTPGWHEALQRFVEMNNVGPFEPGASGTTGAAAEAMFAQGQALMIGAITQEKNLIEATEAKFRFSQRVYAAGTDPCQTTTQLITVGNIAVNAHSSAPAQRDAQTFVEFIQRPAQNALFARLKGGLTQQEFLDGRIPEHMADFRPVLATGAYVASPVYGWWNPNVALARQQNAVGLITGQRSIDDVLKAMEAAWQQGPR
jgi:raffinose/stachyose/melibiose transport system substrate-binding protein